MFSSLRPFQFRILASLVAAWTVAGWSAGEEKGGGPESGGALRPPAEAVRGLTQSREVAPITIKLPFPAGKSYEIFQANHGNFSHSGLNEYAWDFGMPEGSDVCAAAEGRVVRIKQDSNIGGTSDEHYGLANTIVLDHGHGIFTQYLHLKQNSALVKEGDIVAGGAVIAKSGNTGFSSCPHLHFQVQDAAGQSLPAKFADVPGGTPRQGQRYASRNDGTGTSRYSGESTFPLWAFTCNDIEIRRSNLPAHLLKLDQEYVLEGIVKKASQKVVVYLMKPEGGKALISFFANVDEKGHFQAKFSVDALKKAINWSAEPTKSNMFALAIAPVQEDGSYWSTFSIPVSLR